MLLFFVDGVHEDRWSAGFWIDLDFESVLSEGLEKLWIGSVLGDLHLGEGSKTLGRSTFARLSRNEDFPVLVQDESYGVGLGELFHCEGLCLNGVRDCHCEE